MHDYFEILGVPRNARATEIRRACGRRLRPCHPDIQDGDDRGLPAFADEGAAPGAPLPRDLRDAAVDFIEMAPIVERMLARFFAFP